MNRSTFITAFVLGTGLSAGNASASDYTLSNPYNSHSLISSNGELADVILNFSSNGGPQQSEISLKYGEDLGGYGAEYYDITASLPPAQWPSGWGVKYGADRKVLVQHNNYDNPVNGQYETGGSIFDEATESFTRLDAGSRSSWFFDRNSAGYVVGHRDKTGLGHGATTWSEEQQMLISIPWITRVPVLVSPGGGVTEVPHPNGQAYGFQSQTEPYRITLDNEAILTAVNEKGVAVGTGWENDPDAGFFGDNRRFLSFTYNISTGATQTIPGPFGSGSVFGATDINDHGEVVGAIDSSFRKKIWIYLPKANYGLPPGTHFIYESDESSYSTQRDWRGDFLRREVKINNRGQVIFPVWFPSGDGLSKKFWDAGTIRDVNEINPDNSVTISSIIDINDAGQMLVGAQGYQARILSPSPVSLSLNPERRFYHVEETVVLRVTVDHFLPDPATYEFANGPFEFDPDYFNYADEPDEGEPRPDPLFDPIPPFVLSADDEVFTFEIPVTPKKSGVTEITTEATVTEQGGESRVLTLNLQVVIDPLKLTYTVKHKDYALNQQSEAAWGDRAKAVQTKRRQDILEGNAAVFFTGNSPEPQPFTNLLEVELKMKNTTNRTIDRITIPASVESILSLIKSRDTDRPGVPLFPVRFYSHDGTEEDLTDSNYGYTAAELTLAPDGEATFAWVFEAYDANPDPLLDDTANLVFEPLVLGRIKGSGGEGDIDLRLLGEQNINVIDKPLVEWGIRPKDGRVNYLSGQVVRVDGFLENVSGRDGGTPRDILVMMYPLQEGNLGGGFPKKAELPDTDFPNYYEIFELPGEGDGKRIDVDSVFISFPSVKKTRGTARYGIRIWILEDDDSLTKADGQSVVADGWSDEFEVELAGNRPLLSAAAQRRRECIQLGIWPFICGFEEGTIDFTQGVYGLGKFLLATAEGNANLYRGIVAYEMLAMKSLWDAAQGDPDALNELYRESYAKYTQLVELGVMAGEAGSKVPMVLSAFVDHSGDAMTAFFDAAFAGDMEEVQFQTGQFLGANPDLLLEPLVIGMAYARLARSARLAEGKIVSDAIAKARLQERARLLESLPERLAQGKANPAITDLSAVLLAGDKLSKRHLLEIYGIDSKQLEKLQKIARENGVMISFRSRSRLARELLERNLAWPKPQKLKFKTVNEIDVKYLGYPVEAQATVDIVAPPSSLINKTGPDLEIALNGYLDVLAGKRPELAANDVLLGEVRSRIKTRVEEWNDLVPDLNLNPVGNSTVEIPTNFEANLQFGLKKERDLIPDIAPSQKRTVRSTQVDAVTDPVTGQPRKRWEIDMSNPDGGDFRPVSGDVDFMAILEPNGSMILDADRRLKVYKQLAEAVDMQHGESFTFFIDKARKKYLDGNTLGQDGAEALCTISPFGDQTPTAGFFVKSLSIMKDQNSGFLPVREAIKKKDRWTLSEGKVVLEEGKSIITRRPDVSGEYVVIAGADVNSMIDLDFVNRFRPQILKETFREFKARLPFHIPGLIAKAVGIADGSENYARSQGGNPRSRSNTPDSPPLLQISLNPSTGLLQTTVWEKGTGWRFVTSQEAINLGQSGVLDMLPMSYLTEEVPRGSRNLPLAAQEDIGTGGDFFEVGDCVVVDPGTDKEEFGTLVSMSPYTVSTGLIFAHDSGVTVASLGPDTEDRDGDGLNGLEEVALGTAADLFDTDGDGRSDGAEISEGTDPLVAEGFRAGLSFSGVSDGWMFSWDGAGGYKYAIEGTESLNSGSWEVFETLTAEDTNPSILLSDPFPDAEAAFFRLRLVATDDADGDDLSARDELGIGTEPGNADTDGDGFSDGLEIRMGTDPLDSDSKLAFLTERVDVSGGFYSIRFTSVPGMTYQVESSTSGQAGSWQEEITTTAAGAVTFLTIPADLAGEPQRFFRVRFVTP